MTTLSRTVSEGYFVVRITDISGNNRLLMEINDFSDLEEKIRLKMGFAKGDNWKIVEDRTGCLIDKDSCLKATNGFLTVVNTTKGEKWTRPGFCCQQPFERLDSSVIKSQTPGNELLDHQLTHSRLCGFPAGNTIIVGSIQASQVHLGNNNTAVKRDLDGEMDENTNVKQPC